MLVLMPPRVSSRVSGFPVASPCLWGKLHKLSFSIFFNCENWPKSRTKCSFFCAHVSRLESLVLWLRRVYGGSCTSFPFRFFSTVKIGRSLARNARFSAPTCLVSSLWFSCGLAVSMGEVTKSLLFKGFQAGRNFVLRGRRGTLWHSNLFYTVSKVLCVAGATKQYTRHFTLYTLHSTLYTLHFTLHTPHSSLYIPHSALYTLHFPLHTPHSTLYPPHFTLHNLHFRLLTPHSTLYTPRSTLYTPHSTLYTLHFTLHTPHSTLPTPYSPLYTLHSTLHTPQFTLHTRRQSGSKCQGSLVNMSLAR